MARKHSIRPPPKDFEEVSQPKITSVECSRLVPVDSMATSEKKRNDTLLARFIACSNVPTRLVDLEEFHDFLASLNPTYIVPSRPSVDSLISDLFTTTIAKIKSIIAESDYISLSCDFWSVDRYGIYGIIANCYSKKYQERQGLLLCLKYVKAPHTASRIKEETKQILYEFGINGLSDPKIVTISTDSGSNMKKAFALDFEPMDQDEEQLGNLWRLL